MQDYKQMRENMVECQIHPLGVASEDILEAFSSVPRESFVPEDKKNIAYCDEDIEICQGRFLMEPSVIARLLQHSNLQEDDVALAIGSGAGYTAALLSKLVSTVVSLEENDELIEKSQAVWDSQDFCNIVGLSGILSDGAPDHAPYSLIIINGCVTDVPQKIIDQLGRGGRLLAIVKNDDMGIGKATMISKKKGGDLTRTILFDASTPYLKGFEKEECFEF